jgi:hypothetical protein
MLGSPYARPRRAAPTVAFRVYDSIKFISDYREELFVIRAADIQFHAVVEDAEF